MCVGVCVRKRVGKRARERANVIKRDKRESQRERGTSEYPGRMVASWANDSFAKGVVRPCAYRLYF